MKTGFNGIVLLSAAAVLGFSQMAAADYYVSGSYGLSSQDSSGNTGVFSSGAAVGWISPQLMAVC